MTTNNYEHLFDIFWKLYLAMCESSIEAGNKQYAKRKFVALAKKGYADDIIKGVGVNANEGYRGYLKSRRINDNFNQQPQYASTFLNQHTWEMYLGYKYKPPL